MLELDFEPFNASFPRPTLSKSIGNGVEFLNRHLSAKLFHDKESMHPLLEFLRVHCHKGKVFSSSHIIKFSVGLVFDLGFLCIISVWFVSMTENCDVLIVCVVAEHDAE